MVQTVKQPLYGYVPSEAAGAVFVAIFGLLLVAHVFLTVRYRWWWHLTLVLGAIGETLGWAARLWSAISPLLVTPFLIQISTLIFSPAFFSATLYATLGYIIRAVGRKYSYIGPNLYLIIFITADVVCLVVQAVGGGLAANALNNPGSKVTANDGANIMVAGIVSQLVFTLIFTTLAGLFAYRARREVLAYRSLIWLGFAMMISTLFLVVRSIYRTVELLNGWSGYLETTQGFFFLDAAPMIITCGIFVPFPPGKLLRDMNRQIEDNEKNDTAAREKAAPVGNLVAEQGLEAEQV